MIRLRYRWDLPTFLAGYRLHARLRQREPSHQRFAALLVALTLVGAGLALAGRGFGMLAAGGAACLYWYLLRWPLYRWQLAGRFRERAGRDAEFVWEIDAAGLRGSGAGQTVAIGWEQVSRVVSARHGVLLSLPPVFYWLPRGAFGGEEQVRAFLELARAHAAVEELR